MTLSRSDATQLLVQFCFHPTTAELPPDDETWKSLISLALEHGIAPLLWLRLAGRDLPEGPRTKLRALYAANRIRNERALDEQTRIVESLRAAGIAALPLKGPHLSLQLYGDVGARQAADLDVFVQPQEFVRADSTLAVLGYKRLTPGPPHQLVRSAEILYHRRTSDGEFYLDLQLRLSPGLDPDTLAETARGEALAVESLLVFLCVNQVAHRFSRLKYVADIERCIALHTREMDWKRIIRLSRQLECAAGIWLSLRMAKEIAGALIPGDMLARLQPGTVDSFLLRWAGAEDPMSWLAQGAAMEDPAGSRVSLAVTRGLLPRARLVARSLFPHAEYMRERYGGRGSLASLYFTRLLEKAGLWSEASKPSRK